MKSLLIITSAITLITASCSYDAPFETLSDEKKTQVNHLTLTEALIQGEEVYQDFFTNGQSVRTINKSIEEVTYITNPILNTRSTDLPDTLFYIINYTNDEGYMMLSADNRLAPVYAISDNGSLHLVDTLYNKGLAAFYDNSINEALNILSGNKEIEANPIESFNALTSPSATDMPLSYGPLLTEHQQKIGQDAPYNEYLTDFMGVKAKVGCAAVAMEQIFSFYQYPPVISSTLPWENMNEGLADKKIASILKHIGQTMNMNYGTTQSSATYENIINAFKYYDYDPGKTITYMPSVAAMQVYLKHPVYMLCDEIETYGNKGGHAWVIDGYKKTSEFSYGGAQYYLHCVWGWNGRGNGYYLWNTKEFTSYPDEQTVFKTTKQVRMLYQLQPLNNWSI